MPITISGTLFSSIVGVFSSLNVVFNKSPRDSRTHTPKRRNISATHIEVGSGYLDTTQTPSTQKHDPIVRDENNVVPNFENGTGDNDKLINGNKESFHELVDGLRQELRDVIRNEIENQMKNVTR